MSGGIYTIVVTYILIQWELQVAKWFEPSANNAPPPLLSKYGGDRLTMKTVTFPGEPTAYKYPNSCTLHQTGVCGVLEGVRN